MLCPGVVIQPEHCRAIWSIGPGRNKDKRFIKDLTLVAYGPEVLAASTVFGTRKGGIKKEDIAPDAVKPSLNKITLNAIRGIVLTAFNLYILVCLTLCLFHLL